MTSYKAFVSIVITVMCCLFVQGRVTAETNVDSVVRFKPSLIISLSPDVTLSEVTNNIHIITDRYQELQACQLRDNTNATKRSEGYSKFYKREIDPGVFVTFAVNGENITSVKTEDENRTGYTLGYHLPLGGRRRLSAYSQIKQGRADGPYVEFYRNGAVRCLFWFKDGLLTKGKIWDINGTLKESKEFHPPVDIMKEGGRIANE